MLEYSIEKLYHIRCSECKTELRWFTIADELPEIVTCPRCKHTEKPVKIKTQEV